MEFFHQSLFGIRPEALLVQRYQAACRRRLPPASAAEDLTVRKVVARRLDVEAVEYALRNRSPGHALSKRLMILMYLVEARPTALGEFVNLRPGRWRGVLVIVVVLLRSAFKLAKGRWLLWRHGLA